jgi:hypothetical protein
MERVEAFSAGLSEITAWTLWARTVSAQLQGQRPALLLPGGSFPGSPWGPPLFAGSVHRAKAAPATLRVRQGRRAAGVQLTGSLYGLGCRRFQQRCIRSPRCIVPKVKGRHKAGDRGGHADDSCSSRPCYAGRTDAHLQFFIWCHAGCPTAQDRVLSYRQSCNPSLHQACIRSRIQRFVIKRPLHRFGDRLRIAEEILLARRIRPHVLRRHQTSVVTKLLELTSDLASPTQNSMPIRRGDILAYRPQRGRATTSAAEQFLPGCPDQQCGTSSTNIDANTGNAGIDLLRHDKPLV